jgi:hypothetical protein
MRHGSRGKVTRSLGAAAVAMTAWLGTAHAASVTLPTDTGSQTFESTLFADRIVGSRLGGLSFTFQGPYPADFNGISVAAALLGTDLSNGLGISRQDSVTLGFSRPGPALAIWEAGNLQEFGETLLEASTDGGRTFGPSMVRYLPNPVVPDPKPSGYQTNYQLIEASRFGLAPGAPIDALRITVVDGDVAFVHTDILAVASVPEPSSFALLVFGLIALRFARRAR